MRLFRAFWEQAETYQMISARLKIPEGKFWTLVYKIETRLGREFYLAGLYPMKQSMGEFQAIQFPRTAQKCSADEYAIGIPHSTRFRSSGYSLKFAQAV
jgi:hypothetical protein